jgi:tellurite resistance protein
MEQLVIPVLIATLAAVVMVVLDLTGQISFPGLIRRSVMRILVGRVKPPAACDMASDQFAGSSAQPDLRAFNCRIQQIEQEEENCTFDTFTVQIAGTIHAPSDMHHTTLEISITDITDEVHGTKPIHSRVKQWQTQDSPVFCYNADLGKLPQQETVLSEWTSVAQLNIDWLLFPLKGSRNLRFDISILSQRSGEELEFATCTLNYDNPEFGYIDLKENIQRAKTLTVALAFAVSAADGKLYNSEIELIKNWARSNLDVSQASEKARHKLEKALNKTVAFFSSGNQLDIYKICKEIVEIVPLAERYDILDLCLHVARANGVAAAEEMALLKNFATWLEVDTNRFREMVEKILPVGMHEARDEEVILGVSANMSKEITRLQLNKEYNKWNSRVTNPDPEIQSQADQMLKLIAEARSEYVS